MPTLLSDHFGAMARNNAWSNARLHKACAELRPEEFAAKRVSFFPSIRQTLNHILVVDRYYLADLKGTGRVILEDEIPFPDADRLAAAQAEIDRQLIAFCASLDDADMERMITIDRGDGTVSEESVGAVLAHLFVHQIHHRGQAHAMLAGTRVPPPQLDEFFLAADAPLRETELHRLGFAGPERSR
jgi:uncharacterized damage-inducible protein DinB